jgi:D-alanyl-D-alanine carboxypeptidase
MKLKEFDMLIKTGLSRIAGAVLAVVLLLTAGGCTTVAAPEPVGQDPNAWQAMLHQWRSRGDAPATALGVATGNGETWVGVDGTPERGGHTPVRTDSPFRIASITKVFVAVVVLQLVEEGRLRLDDPASRYAPDAAHWPVTIRQLLNHTSGIPDFGMADEFGEELAANRDRRWTAAEAVALVADDEPTFSPGTDYAYSNTNYVLLGEAIETVTRHGWAQEVRRRILDPLGMRDTYVAGFEPVRRPPIAGYFDLDNDGNFDNVETGQPWTSLETSDGAAGCIVSTALDLLAFGDALFHGRLLSAETMQAMTAEGPFHPRFTNYGLGLEIARPDYRTTIWGHGGYLPGFRSSLWYVPTCDAVIVVLANDARAEPRDLAELAMRRLPVRES